MNENFREFLDRLRARERARRHQAAGRHPPHRDARRPVRQGALLPRRDRLRHAGRVGHHPHARALDHGHGLHRVRRDRAEAAAGHRPSDPAALRRDRAPQAGDQDRRRRRSLQAADPDVLDLRRRPDDHRRRGDREGPGVRPQLRHLPLHGEGEEPDRHRHRHAQQHALFAQRALRSRPPLPDLDLDRHAPVRDHGRGLPRADRRGRDGDRRRPARRAGRARAVRDDRPAVHRRRRDRARSRDPADRLDAPRRPLRRVHAPDGRAALEPAGAREGDHACARTRSTTRCTCRGRTPGSRRRRATRRSARR